MSAKSDLIKLEELLNSLTDYFHEFADIEIYNQKNNQLNSIEFSIKKLRSSNTPIPDDLRRLKIKLIHDLEEYKVAKDIKKTTVFKCKEFIELHRERRAKNNTLSQKELF
jgi:hypothetical protein